MNFASLLPKFDGFCLKNTKSNYKLQSLAVTNFNFTINYQNCHKFSDTSDKILIRAIFLMPYQTYDLGCKTHPKLLKRHIIYKISLLKKKNNFRP